MDKNLIAIGLMSGTSMDGVDASIIRSDGEGYVDIIGDLYLKYDSELKNSLHCFCNKINSLQDLNYHINEYKDLERVITLKHSEIASEIINKFNISPQVIGFHGQTIVHKPKEKYSIQMGDAKLLSQLLKKNVVYQFRKNDIDHGGEGAPLTPVYHYALKKKLNLKNSVVFLNIGGIANYTYINDNSFSAKDIGPGNCLMDMYIKKSKNLDYDKDGELASIGKIDNSLINNILDHEYYNTKKKNSLDVKDFDVNFVKGLSTEDALANLNFFTAKIISQKIKEQINGSFIIILCGGGRKNKVLISNLKKLIDKEICIIDDFNIDGNFVESQAFGYLSIRSLYGKNISFPSTTNVSKSLSGGELITFS